MRHHKRASAERRMVLSQQDVWSYHDRRIILSRKDVYRNFSTEVQHKQLISNQSELPEEVKALFIQTCKKMILHL